MQQELRDIETQTTALTRQQKLDTGVLNAQQGIARAKMQANNAAINGLLSLSKTAVSTMGQMAKTAEIAQQQQALNDEATSFLVGPTGDTPEVVTPRIDNAVILEGQQDAQAYAIGDIAASTNDKATAEVIAKDSANALAARSYTKISTYDAGARIAPDLEDFLRSDEIVSLPDGRQIRASEASDPAEIAAVARFGIQKLTRQYGLASMDPRVLRQTYLTQAQAAYRTAIANRGKVMREAAQSERAIAHFGAASGAIQSGVDPAEVYQTLYNSIKSSQFETDPRKVNKFVREHIINVARGMGQEGIAYLESLKGVQQVPGMKGTELGSGPYAVDIDKAIREIRTGAVTDYRTTKSEQKMSLEAEKSQYQMDLLNAQTPEGRVAIAEQFENSLMQRAALGDQDAFTELQNQRGIDNRYNPNAYGELMDSVARNERISQTQLTEARNAGSITLEQAEAVKEAAGGNFVEALNKTLESYQSGWKKKMSALLAKEFKHLGGSQDRAEVATYTDDAVRVLNDYMADWLSDNPKAPPSQIAEKAEKMMQKIIDDKVTTPQGKLMKPEYDFGNNKPFTSPVSGQQARNLQYLETQQLLDLNKDGSADNDIDIYNDSLITTNQLREEIKRMRTGGDASPRVKQLAIATNTTPRNLIYSQAVGKGIDLDSLPVEDEGSGSAELVEPTDIVSGTRFLQTLGYSARGSAYLAANIQQESSWNGMRSWGAVFNPTTGEMDGTSRNGGLVSWASWANSPARLGAIENYLGKPIEQATHSEQLRAMVWEMETNSRFANARRTFRDPSATDAQLRRASFEYWGYGHEGVNRFGSYLNQALDAING